MRWLWVHAGLSSGNSAWYLLPSGWGSILIPPLLTAVPIVWVLLRHRNCEVHRCWRLGRHKTAAGHVVCRRHMPGGAPTAEDVHRAHHAARRRHQDPRAAGERMRREGDS